MVVASLRRIAGSMLGLFVIVRMTHGVFLLQVVAYRLFEVHVVGEDVEQVKVCLTVGCCECHFFSGIIVHSLGNSGRHVERCVDLGKKKNFCIHPEFQNNLFFFLPLHQQ